MSIIDCDCDCEEKLKSLVDEVLVDCTEYYLISTNTPIVQDYMGKNKLGTFDRARFTPNKIETYSQLFDILKNTIAQYKK